MRLKRFFSYFSKMFTLSLALCLMLATGAFAATSAPTGVTASPGDGSVVVSWSTVTGAASYNVYYKLSSDTTWTQATSGVTATSYTVTGLTNATAYDFAVTSYDSTDSTESAQSAAVTATPVASGGSGSTGALDLTATVGFTPADLFSSAMSLAGNFWPFLLLGLSFVIAPWIYGVIVSAIRRRTSRI